MPQKSPRIGFVLLLLTLAFTLIGPQPVRADMGSDFADALDRRMPDLLAKYRVPGAVVAYIQNGEVAWTQAYGIADRSTSKPMSEDMIFNFGSCGKVLTGWGVMRLVDQGKVDLDAPVNQYLKRWQIKSAEYDADQVTVRRLLSHTAGLTVPGFSDYSQRRILPTLVEMLEGRNQAGGKVTLFREPGKGFQYSGGGYVILQMIIEDVSGEPFAQFMEREVTGPLEARSIHWTWTPELSAQAPVPYGQQQEALGYRQLASQAIGSEIGTVPDFARFIVAAVSGPNGEAPGRGVLKPETLAEMTRIQPNAENEGLAYGVTSSTRGLLLQHFGSNPGWNAFFSIDTGLREGLVMATNSSNGFPLNAAVQNLWIKMVYHQSSAAYEPPPDPDTLSLQSKVVLGLVGVLALPLAIYVAIFIRDLLLKKRTRGSRPSAKNLLGVGIWTALALFWGYWFYTSLPLPFLPGFPDFWHTRQVDLVSIALAAWVLLSLGKAWLPSVKG